MGKKRRPALEERLAELAELADEPDQEVVLRELRRGLDSRRAPVAAKAARLVGELSLINFAAELAAAFDRFMIEPVKSDRGCVAKTAIARALVELGEPRETVFLRGVRHRQPEPAYGGPVDTAAELRGICAHGLAGSGHPDAVLELVNLLVDPEWQVRAEAPRALGSSGRFVAEPLLRLKALSGDKEPDVVAECLGGLLAIDSERSLDFVAGFLDSREPGLAQAAALALGESRQEEAVAVLKEACGRCSDPELRRTLLLSIAMTRRPPAFDFLIVLVAEARPGRAAEALAALAIHRHDDRIRERVETVLADRGPAERGPEAEVHRVFEREFSTPRR